MSQHEPLKKRAEEADLEGQESKSKETYRRRPEIRPRVKDWTVDDDRFDSDR